jgi:CubicO group peptidase (beta-lactamase class C family)
MLFLEEDGAAFAARQALDFEPDSVWSYSSGTSNIISKKLKDSFGGADSEYLSFPFQELFEKIGMESAIIEPDRSGTFVLSSFGYATARDWARFGLLYLQDGVWNGNRILPEGWVKYTTTPTPKGEHK